MNTSKVIDKFELPTANRGIRTFIISTDGKGYFAHELLGLTQWAKVFGWDTQNASMINPYVRRGNQYGKYWRPQRFVSIHSARIAAQITSSIHIIR